jgi:hypothetical protein
VLATLSPETHKYKRANNPTRTRTLQKPKQTKRVASERLGLTDAELEQQLAAVAALAPDLAPRLPSAPVDMVVALAADPGRVAARLLAVKAAFPRVRFCVCVCVWGGGRVGRVCVMHYLAPPPHSHPHTHIATT